MHIVNVCLSLHDENKLMYLAEIYYNVSYHFVFRRSMMKVTNVVNSCSRLALVSTVFPGFFLFH